MQEQMTEFTKSYYEHFLPEPVAYWMPKHPILIVVGHNIKQTSRAIRFAFVMFNINHV